MQRETTRKTWRKVGETPGRAVGAGAAGVLNYYEALRCAIKRYTWTQGGTSSFQSGCSCSFPFYGTLEAQPMEIELFAVETNGKQSNKDQ